MIPTVTVNDRIGSVNVNCLFPTMYTSNAPALTV